MNQKKRYNQIWGSIDIQDPKIWSTWEISKNFQGKTNLGIGSGGYPKIPIKNGYFLDICESAMKDLKKMGANTFVGDAIDLPFKHNFFDFVTAMEVLEHIENDQKAVDEIFRVLKLSGFFMLSVPLKMELYTEIDKLAGHCRRYEIKELKDLVENAGFKIVKYRYPSKYVKKLNSFLDSSRITKALYRSEKSWGLFNMPRFLLNWLVKIWAFMERRGAPKWCTDIEKLEQYPDKAIVMLCQKINNNTSE